MTLEQGVEAGVFEPDIRKAFAGRVAKGDRAILNHEFFADTAKRFGVKVSKGAPVPAGYVQPALAAEPSLRTALKGVYLPQEIATDLEKMVELPKQGDRLAQLATGTTALWKGYATRANPGFHVRNAVSNMVQTWFGGIGSGTTRLLDPAVVLQKHAAAAKLLDPSTGKLVPDNIPSIGPYQASDVERALHDYGVVSKHSSFNEMDDLIEGEIRKLDKTFAARNLNPLDRRNALLRGGAFAGNLVENTSRLALFLDQVEKGKSLEEAALHVRKYLFDYSELTDFERKVRDRALPFYTWLRKNVPLQVDNALRSPDKMATLAKGFDSLEDVNEDRGTAVSSEEKPDWMRDYIQLPLSTEKGAAVLVNPMLPVQDLNKLLPDPEKDILAAVNPLVRVPLELATNRQFFLDAPLRDPNLGITEDYRKANPLLEGLSKVAPGMMETVGVIPTTSGVQAPTLVDYLMRQLPPFTQLGRAAAALTGDEETDPGKIEGIVDPDALNFAGLLTRTLDDQQRRQERKRNQNARKTERRAQQRERRKLKKAEVSSLYQRYLEGS